MADALFNQTLKEFLESPFGHPDEQKRIKYEDRYQAYKKSNKIHVEGTLELDDSYFVHVKVPSEDANADIYYDVVIQFFVNEHDIFKGFEISNYYVHFFSNSPGFVYRYAALYKLNGYLISSLYDKLGESSLDTLPDKSNKTYELYYDSSIYYAARYLLDNRLTVLNKFNIKFIKKKSADKFFGDIQDFESLNISRDVSKTILKIKQEIKTDKTNAKPLKNENNDKHAFNRVPKKESIKPVKSTVKDKATSIIHRTPKISKKTATKSTIKKGL